MDCKKSQALLSSYIDKKISIKEKDLLELHLRDCEVCQDFFKDLKDTIKLINSLEEVKLPPDLFGDIQKEIEKLPEAKGFFQKPLWVRIPIEVLGTATVMLIIFFLSRSLIQFKTPEVKDVFVQKETEISSRWMSQEGSSTVIDTPEKPASVLKDDNQMNSLIEKERKMYREEDAPVRDETVDKKDLKEPGKIQQRQIASYFNEPPDAWEKSEKVSPAVTKKSDIKNKDGKIRNEYDISIQVDNLYDGINELTTQVHNHKGNFINPPAVMKATGEEDEQKEIIFKIPRENYYQFIWNLEKIGIMKEIIPVGSDKIGIQDVTVHLKIKAEK